MNIYDQIIFSIMSGFIAIPLYLGYVEFVEAEPSRLAGLAIGLFSIMLTAIIIYLLSNSKKEQK